MTLNVMPWILVQDSAFLVATRPLFENGAWLQVGDEYPSKGNEKALQALYLTNRIEPAPRKEQEKKRKKGK
jgi:hypothetical protein